MKLRFTTLDVIAAVTELKTILIGLRIVNIYDVNNKTYLLKLVGHDITKVFLIESGIRIHTTEFAWPKHKMPSSFSMKLRKHLRNRRISDVFQFGVDRVIGIIIGKADTANYLFIELFDKGNIFLCDADKKIISILRWRRNPAGNNLGIGDEFSIKVEHTIPMHNDRETIDQLLNAIEDKTMLVKEFLFNQFHIGLAVIEQLTGKNSSLKKTISTIDVSELHLLYQKILSSIKRLTLEPARGIIKCQSNQIQDGPQRFTDFYPSLQGDLLTSGIIEFDSFLKATDAYFSQIEKQKEDVDIFQKEKVALSKLLNVEKDIGKRSRGLQDKQAEFALKADIIQDNIEIVGQALLVVKNALENDLSWEEVAEMVAKAKIQNNPVANIVEELRLMDGVIILKLWDELNQKFQKIEVDVDLGAYKNIQLYHARRKELADKERRTKEATEKALKSAKKKTDKMLKQTEAIVKIGKQRKYLWFEKFYWFISSQNYLIVAGRDQHQNTFLVKKYLLADDIYVHSTIHGGSSVIIKNHKGGAVPLKTLNEAGHMAVCYSKSWDSKVICPVYWVHANQVSKVAPSGTFISAGSFIITGKRNFIKPESLLLGYGLLFKISEEDAEHHKNDSRFQTASITEVEEISADETEETVIHTTTVGEEIFMQDLSKFTKSHPQRDLRKAIKKNAKNKKNQVIDEVPKVLETNITRRLNRKNKRKNKDVDEDYDKELKKINDKIQGRIAESNEESKTVTFAEVESESNVKEEIIADEIEELSIDDQLESDSNASDASEIIAENCDAEQLDEENDQMNVESLDILSTLIENPNPNDESLFCLAVCAPYSALLNYRFKAKLQHGTTKRGKAANQIIKNFIQNKLTTSNEKNLIKAMKDTEICQNLPGSVKILAVQVTENVKSLTVEPNDKIEMS